MARNDVDERNRRQSYSPNARDFDREYNAQGSSGNRFEGGRDRFENQYSDNAERWTGYDEGPQHWREHQYERQGGGQDYERNRQEFGRGQDYGPGEGRGNYGREQYREREFGPESGRGERSIQHGGQRFDTSYGPGGQQESGRGNWGGVSTYGSGVSGYSAVGPYNSPGLGSSYAGMGNYGSGYAGGMGSYTGRGRGQHAGRGPKGYRRSDDRIREEVNDRLTDHPDIDPSNVEVRVEAGVVTLTGTVEDRHSKRLAEDIAEGVAGVSDVNNQIRVQRQGEKPQEEVDDQQVTRLGINPGDRKLKQTETK